MIEKDSNPATEEVEFRYRRTEAAGVDTMGGRGGVR